MPSLLAGILIVKSYHHHTLHLCNKYQHMEKTSDDAIGRQ
jgi:hypothetical protein